MRRKKNNHHQAMRDIRELSDALSEAGEKGGKVKNAKKASAVRRNILKALISRWPQSPNVEKWRDEYERG